MDKSKLDTLQESLTRVLSCIREYNAVLWAGSGLSLYAGYPSCENLCRRLLESTQNDNDRKILEQNKHSLADLSNEFSLLYSRDRLVDVLKECFDAAPTTEPTTHSRITKIPQINTIITTNYDHLFEIVYDNSINVYVGSPFKKSEKGMTKLFKIHGDTSNPDSIVITSKDYAKFYNDLDTLLWGNIKWLLAEKSVIFIGYSLDDKNIQDVFENIISQIDASDKEFFFVTPTLDEYRLRYFDTICKTTHIPLYGDEFLEYIESEIRKNIVLDALKKKVSIDESYRICREYGITPTIVNEPYGKTTRPNVERIELSPEAFFDEVFSPIRRGLKIYSSPETSEAVAQFLNDYDCKELVVPANDAITYKDIKGILIPENQKVNGQLPSVVKIVKEEIIEELTLMLGDNNHLGCIVRIKGFWGDERSRMTIEMACMRICILHESETTNFSFSFKYPYTASEALSDLSRIKLWCNGTDLVFYRANNQQAFVLRGLIDGEVNELGAFVDDNMRIYNEIRVIEDSLKDSFCIEKELTTEDIQHIHRASSSASPIRIKYLESYTVNAGKMTLRELEIYRNTQYAAHFQMTYPEVLPDDCFQLFDKSIVLGIRNISLVEPYINNIDEAKLAASQKRDVFLQYASKQNEAILEYLSPSSDNQKL